MGNQVNVQRYGYGAFKWKIRVMVGVVINGARGSRVTINRTNTAKTVRSVNVPSTNQGGGGSDTLAGLTDVDVSDADTGEVLVWNEATEKYEVKPVPVIDGGEF